MVLIFGYFSNCAGDDASLDIVPVTGTLQFISNVQQQLITLSVVPDDVPEVAEVMECSCPWGYSLRIRNTMLY